MTKISLMFRVYLSVLIVFLGSCNSKPTVKTVKDYPELNKIIATFFEKYGNGTPDQAVNYLFETNRDVNIAQLKETRDKLSSVSLLAGIYNGYEIITVQNRSASLVYYSYLVKHDKQPLRLTFIFYKPKGEWKALRFKFDDEVTTELEQSGKLYFLQ